MILSLCYCNMILLVDASSLRHHTTHHCHCVGFLFLGLHSLPSPPSPSPPFFLSLSFAQVLSHNTHNSSHTTLLLSQLTQLISHLSSLTTQLTQLISLNSSHTTQLTQELLSCGFWWRCFRVLSLNITQVLSYNSSHNSHNSSHTTLSSHYSHNSSHTTQLTQELLSCCIWWSCVDGVSKQGEVMCKEGYCTPPHPTPTPAC